MVLVEDIGNRNKYNPDVYFTSTVSVYSAKRARSSAEDTRPRKRLAPGTYNLTAIESNLHGTALEPSLLVEKQSTKRFAELDRENYSETARIELPKSGLHFDYPRFAQSSTSKQGQQHMLVGPKGGRLKTGSTTQVKKILASRKQLHNYLDEDDKNSSILFNVVSKKQNSQLLVPSKKLCSICGDNAPSSCIRCNARVCSVKCVTVHNETRCANYYG